MLIHDSTPSDVLFDKRFGRGLTKPDYERHPDCKPLMKVSPKTLKLIPKSEWSARIKEKKRLKSRLSDIRRRSGPGGGPMPSLNQGQWPYCWAHSPTMAHMLLRAVMGGSANYVKLSAFMVAAIIKGGAAEGGWGALALEFIEKYGQPPVGLWPEGSARLSNDTAAMRAEAAKYKIVGDWADMDMQVYDRNMSEEAVATLLLNNVPVIADFNDWGHSVPLMDWDEIEPGSFGPRGLNSWGDEWGDLGEFTRQGRHAVPDGATAPLAAMAEMMAAA